MRRLLHSSWISLLGLVVLVGALTWYVGWTESGLQRLVALANRRLGPVTLTIRGARGTLHDGLHADSVLVEHRRVRILATGVDGRVLLLPLLWQSIQVRSAQIQTLQIRVLAQHDNGAPWQPHFLIGLLTLQADQVALAHGELITPGGNRLTADQLHANAAIDVRDLHIYDGAMRYAGFLVQAKGQLRAAIPLQIHGTLRLSMTAEQPAWLANAQLEGDLDRLNITGHVLTPFSADVQATARALTGEWHWYGTSQVRGFDLRAWGAGGALGVITGELALQGNRDGFGARGTLTPPGLHGGPLAVGCAGNYGDRTLSIRELTVLHKPSGTLVQASGSVGVVSGGPRLDLHGQWHGLRWPLDAAAAPVGSESGDFALGGLWPYQLHAGGALRVLDLPGIGFTAQGLLRRDGLELTSANLAAWGGQAQLHGEARWSPRATWMLAGSMTHLNVATLRPGIDGRLNFDVQASGQDFGAGSSLQSHFTSLGGSIRGQRASGQAGIALQGKDWRLQGVRLQLGATHIDLDGRLGESVDLRFAVDAADLGLLHSGASGTVRGQGHLLGDAQHPLLQGTLHGGGIRWDGATVQALDASVDFDPLGSARSDATVTLSHLQIGERRIDSLRWVSHGTAPAQRFEFDLRAPSLSAQGGGNASFAKGVWHAQLLALETGAGADIHLSLAQPVPLLLALDGTDLELGQLCLSDEQARLCGAASSRAGQRHFELNASSVPLSALTAGVVTDTDFAGTLTVAAHGDGATGQPWTGSLSGTLAGAKLTHHLVGGRAESFSLGTGSMQATADSSGLNARLALDAGPLGSISAHVDAHGTSAPWSEWPITGALQLQTQALGFIDSYAAQVDRVSGRLNADLTLAGTLVRPSIDGELRVSDAQVDAYQVNLALRDINLDARLHDSTLQLEGSASAGSDGRARCTGTLTWRNGLPYGQLHLAGENLRVVNIPEARVQASPDVDIKLAAHRIDVTGTITLPYARLERPDQLTNAVRASSDEVLISTSAPQKPPLFQVFSDVTLKLGDRVTIDTLGLSGRLSGSLRTVTNDTGFDRGTGELQIEEGKYAALGRKLDIERGRLLFADGPLNDPGIDLRAVKKFPDITAGVNVRGTLRSPRTTFFSDPPVAQTQIVSLLLAGGSLESVQNTTDPSQRNNAARNNMLLQGSAALFQQYGSKVGLDDVSVESDLNNDTSLVLGRYLSPRLYVSYGISLAESINTVKMRYTISDHWTIKTEAGTARSADLVYTIQR